MPTYRTPRVRPCPLTGRRASDHAHLPDAARPVLNADPRADRSCRLRHRVLPRPLTAAAHDEQVAVAELEAQRRSATARRAQQQRTRCADRHARPHGVLSARATDAVAVPGDAVATVAVEAQPC